MNNSLKILYISILKYKHKPYRFYNNFVELNSEKYKTYIQLNKKYKNPIHYIETF